MSIHQILNILLLVLCHISTLPLLAQSGSINPIVNADHTVTFRVCCPQANQVVLCGNFIPRKVIMQTKVGLISKEGKINMVKTDNGWTYTTQPLESDFYTYQLLVNGEVPFVDPLNPRHVRDINDTLNYFILPDGLGDLFSDCAVPHGTVKKVWYPSHMENLPRRRMSIYLPAEYTRKPSCLYPVLYLLHGSGGDENAWLDNGRAAQILDNLINSKRCPPMIVVMPNGNVNLAAAPGEDPAHPHVLPRSNNFDSMFGQFERSFVDEIVAFVERNYRVLHTRDSRAIAGLSMGGLHTLYISANYPQTFGYVGLFSAQTDNSVNIRRMRDYRKVGNTISSLKSALPFLKDKNMGDKIWQTADSGLSIYEDLDAKLARQFSNPPQLYYISLGKDDFVKKLNDDFRKILDEKGYSYVYRETSGGHTWDNWRRYLIDFLPRLFQ